MRLTGLGHASVLIETAHGSILTDPWVNPAYFGSWFPFPDNSQLDWDALGQVDYLFVSHLHHDHFDPENLRRHVRKDITVLLPEFPTSELEDSLRELGFHNFVAPASEEVVEIDGLQIMIQSLVSPTDGPIGDSSLWVYDGQQRLLNQNDARPSELDGFTELGPIDAYLVQFSGAIWYPMVYELPKRAKQALGLQKRERQFDRTLRYIQECAAAVRLPDRGPAVLPGRGAVGFQRHLRRRVEHLPGPDVYLSWLAERGHDEGRLLLPGSVASVDRPGCPVTHPYDPALVFEHKEQYLREYQARRMPAVEAVKAGWAHPEIDVLAELTKWFTPLLEEAEHMAARHRRRRAVHRRGRRAGRRRLRHRLRRPRGPRVRGGEGSLPVPHPARLSRTADRASTRSTGSTACSCPAGSRRSASGRTTSSSTCSSSASRRSG